ncbi:protein bassoon [Dromiciops gliroides]|uniref:protein bassoon n=1 Tax=Dromiciops gliroides TaxID=33562 RepID=UPI001CC4A210|nr:protein bassoon [Dromiciops gliroides]
MGNEASLEGGAGDGLPAAGGPGPSPTPGPGPGPGPTAGKAPSAPGGGQLPSVGAARAAAAQQPRGPSPGPGPGPGPGPSPGPGPTADTASMSRRLDPKDHLEGQRATSPTPKQAGAPSHEGRRREMRTHGQAGPQVDGPHRTLQVDSRMQRTGRSPSVSPDRGSTPTSPYSVPQIAPLPSSTLCPICKTTDLTSSPNQPNFNTCTQCHNKVCNQCGFNPNPHLTEVKEWLCLNCQMQRALGMDMTTAPRSKSQQQLYSPSLSPAHSPAKQPQPQPQMKPQPQPQPPTQAHRKPEPEKIPGTAQPGLQQGPSVRQAEGPRTPVAPGQREAPSQGQARPTVPQEAGRVPPQTHPSPAKGVTPAPGSGAQEQAQEGLTGKLFGFGASLLTQASTLMSVQPEVSPQGQPSPGKGPPKIVFSDASKEAGPKTSGTGPGPGAGAGRGTGPAPGAGPGAGPGPVSGVGTGAGPRAGPGSGPGPRPGVGTGPKAGPGPGPASGPKSEPGSGPGALGRPAGAPSPKQSKAEHQAAPKAVPKPKEVPKEKVTCPLCQAELNVGSREPSNYNTCTTCKLQVCNLCGFNPTPHLVEKNEWLCLNCQTQRLLEGSLGDPAPVPMPTPKQTPTSSPRHQAGPSPQKQKGPPAAGPGQPGGPPHTSPSLQTKHLRASEPSKPPSGPQEKEPSVPAEAKQVPKPSPLPTTLTEAPKTKDGPKRAEPPPADSKVVSITEAPRGSEHEDPSKPYSQDLSRSPQSLSDTGYSSDGISSSQSEITGLVQQEEEQLNTAGVVKPSPPSPSELNKLESSMRPLLEAPGGAPGEQAKARPQPRDEPKQRQRPRSLSITPEAFDSDEELEDILEEDEDSLEWENQKDARDTAESSDDFGSKLRHDYVEDSSEGGLSPLPTRPADRDAEGPDEDFMRRQILEMSAEEDNLEEEEAADYDRAKYSLRKAASKAASEQGQEPAPPKRRLPHNATTGYEEELKDAGAPEPEDVAALQGGLRRFKTIELNSTNNYGRELEISQEADISLDREPELEMESLTGSPEDRSRGEYSSTLPATTPSYTSGTSPTSLSSLEEDSDSSPSRRQRLEEVKQQRKARHRSHGPLLPTIEDSSEEEELREEEELLREQEKMREVEQQRIRSTARKTKRDKEELRAQRRRERSKTPPSNLSPIEDASPTEELRQAAEMEELHRSSCSEYSPSPSLDSEAEGFEMGTSKLYKSGSEYNLPTFMSLYSPTEKTSGGSGDSSSSSYSSGKPLKSAEEAYEEMMRKAELLQKQQGQQAQPGGSYGGGPRGPDRGQGSFEYQYIEDYDYVSSQLASSQPSYEPEAADAGAVYEEILQTSQSIARMHQASSRDLAFQEDKKDREDTYQEKQFLNAESAYSELMRQNGGPLTPGTSPTQLAAPMSFSADSGGSRVIPDVRVTQHFAKEPQDALKLLSSPASPSSALKGAGAPFAYSKATPPVTTVVSGTAGRPRVYTAATSPAGPEPALPTTASYGSQTEEMPQAQALPDTCGLPARERLQSMADSKTGAPLTSKVYPGFKGASPPLSPTSPLEGLPSAISRMGPKATAEFSTQTHSPLLPSDVPRSPISPTASSMVAQGTQTPHRASSPRLTRQQSSQESPFMVITLASDAASQTKLVNASSSTSPVSSPTRHQPVVHSYSQSVQVNGAQFQQEQPPHSFPKGERTPTSSAIVPMNAAKGHVTPAMDGTAALYGWGALPAENISLCRISSVPGTSRVEPGPKPPTSSAVDLRTAMKSTPIIITDQGMDLTSLAAEARKYCLTLDQSPGRQSTTVQPLIINLNAQEHTHTFIGTSTTVSITVASSMLVSQPKQPVVYGDPFQNRLDFGQGTGSPVCLTQVKHVEQAVQTGPYQGGPRGKPKEAGSPQQTKFARYNLPNQMAPLVKKDILVTQMSATQNVSIKPYPAEPSSDAYRGTPADLKASVPTHLAGKKPHMMMVQMDDVTAGAVTKLVKEEPASALDLTGIKPESQVACCDVVYKFPFSSSCTGTFHPSSKIPEKNVVDTAQPSQSSLQFYGSREQDLAEPSPYREQAAAGPRLYEEQKLYSHGLMGRLYSSMSDTNLAEAGLNYYPHKSDQFFHPPGGDSAMDLTTMKHSYSIGFDGRYLGQGMQYGSFTDLRQPPDLMGHPLPMRRYSSASNIYSDYRYSPRGDLSGFQESSLAQYSATTAREISRMCAALNSMDQYGGRHSSSPELLQYGPRPGPGASAQQGLAAIKPNMMVNPNFPESRQSFGKLAQYSPAPGQGGGAIRQLFPSTATVRAADGMIYSTINTPIASTLPITTQPASVLRPMVRGIYRPYGPGSITPVPLASLTRVPVVAPRVPLMPQGMYRYPPPSRFPAITTAPGIDGPLYLGKAGPAATVAGSSIAAGPAGKPVVAAAAGGLQRTEQPLGGTREEPPAAASMGSKEASPAPSHLPSQKQPGEAPPATVLGKAGGAEKEEKEEERQRKQQEHMLQMERERVELEKLRQLRLHEELERERVELQRHREKEQMLVQREIQELQTIKHQVLQQQQEERQAQFALQREQLAQQRLQLEQIQQLQQQLQQQLEEQKRQKAPFPPVCDPSGRLPPQAVTEIALEMQRTMAPNGQYWPPINQAFMATAAMGMEGTGQPREPGPPRPLPNSASDMSLQTDEHWEAGRGLKKRHSMPRLRDAYEMEEAHEPYVVKKITDSSVQTDEEDGEERYFMSRRRRTRRSTDCSVQTDDEDNADWEQPVRRRRTRFSRHSDSVSDSKHDSSSSPRSKSSVGIQTISDCSVQTEPDQLLRVSPSIHITTPDPKVEIIKYISAPEKTQRGESLACQTEPEAQAQGIVVPQLTGPAAITPYTPSIQIVTTGPLEPRQQGLGKFEKKKPDPLEIGYQSHLPTESLSQLVTRQPPKSPQVLYSPVSPLSPHRLLESSFASSERLNKAHVTPQKHFTADSAQRQQTVPRPMKTMQRSLSDPKPISPTAEESAKERFSLYQQQVLQGTQMSAFQANTLIRKVKRTLPSPPPEEAHMPLPSQAHSQMYMASLLQKGLVGPPVQVTKASLLKELDRDLKLVEHESTKLRKKQAELDEEEKEIDAKLKYLELGITQRKGSLMKDRVGRDYPYLRCLGDNRDYMSDSELNNLRLAGYESGAVHVRPSTAPTNQYSDYSAAQYTSASSYPPYQYPPGQGPPPAPTAFQHTRFQPPQYPVGSAGPAQNGFQANQVPAYPAQSTYPAPGFPPSAGYPPDHGLQGQQNFRPAPHYQPQTTYPGQIPHPPPQNALFPEPADSHAAHQKPRQTSLADLEQKVPTNYEVIAAPPAAMSSAPSEPTYSTPAVTSSYDQYKTPEPPRPGDRSGVSQSPGPTYSSESLYTNLEQNIPRNYVMIDDISELTKDSTPSAAESQKPEPRPQGSNGRHMKDKSDLGEPEGPSAPCCYAKGEEESEEDVYDHHSADHRGKSSYHRSSESNGRMSGSGGGSSYYYGDSDYRHSSRPEKHGSSMGGPKHSSKNLAPAVISTKRSKHRKQGMEQKISKFSPIEEAKDVESDLASYPTTPSVSSSMSSRGKKFQDEITYGLKKNVYEQQKYYGVSSRDLIEEDDRAYSSRSRSSASYGGEKSSHDMSSRGKSYERERERESMERLQKASSKPSSLSMSQSRGRPPMRSQASEEESPISPLGRSVGGSRSSGGPLPSGAGDGCSPFCSSHSLPDVQEHIKDVPRTHSYKHEEGYILDDSHCVVSDSEAYHLGQEETDWFDKPRESRSERLRHHGGHSSSSSSQKRPPVKHTYHDYDEPPEEDLWPHDEGPQGRHSSKEHRHHGDYGRHSSGSSSSRHQGEEPSRRVSKPHPRDSGRHEGRPHSQPSSQKKAQQADPRGQPSYPSSQSEYSQPSRQSAAYHHPSEPKKALRPIQSGPSAPPPKSEPLAHSQPQQARQPQSGPSQQQLPPQSSRQQQSRQPLPQQQPTGHGPQPTQSQTQQTPSQTRLQQQQQQQQGMPGQPSSRGQQPQAAQQAGKSVPGHPPSAGAQPAGPLKAEQLDSSKPTAKVQQQQQQQQQQQGRVPHAQPQGAPAAGTKIGAKPGGIPPASGAPGGQPGADGESVFSKILPGGAAEQAGKLTEAVSAFGKKFSSFW